MIDWDRDNPAERRAGASRTYLSSKGLVTVSKTLLNNAMWNTFILAALFTLWAIIELFELNAWSILWLPLFIWCAYTSFREGMEMRDALRDGE